MNIFLSLFFLLLSPALRAYEYNAKDLFIRSSLGAKINAVRMNESLGKTPSSVFVTGVNVDYTFASQWDLIGSVRPGVAADVFDCELALGVKFRALEVDLPIVPYATIQLVKGFLIPIKEGAVHYSLGVRPAIGLDYFLMRNFTISLEIMSLPLVSFVSYRPSFEFGAGFSFGVGWRI